MPLFFIVVMFSYWMYISGHITHVGTIIDNAFGLERQMGYPGVVDYISTVPLSETLLNISGLLLFYFFSVIGILVILSKGLRNPDRFCFILGSAAVTLVALLGSTFGLTDLLPDRILANSQILLSVPAAAGIIFLSNVFRQRHWKFVALTGLMVILSFLWITSHSANQESPIYSHNTSYRLSYTQSEMQAANTIFQIYEGKVITDSSYKAVLLEKLHTRGITGYLISKDFTDVDKLVVIRDYSVEHLAYGGGIYLQLDYDPRPVLGEQGFSHIYNCGTVSAFLP